MKTETNNTFEIVEYSKDYYHNGKYVGSIKVKQPDREVMGYKGRKVEVLTDNIQFGKTKKLKKGLEVITELQSICGRITTN